MRRGLPSFAALILGAFSLAAFGAAPPATAPPSPPDSFAPKFHECHGAGITAIYRVTGPDGKDALSLKISNKRCEFKGDQITSVSLALGDIKEVILEVRPDIGSTSATLILPRINLVQKPALLFQAQLAVTRNSMPFIRIPPDGVVNVSTYYPLVCIARKEADASYGELFSE
jgi:hypothetical protein